MTRTIVLATFFLATHAMAAPASIAVLELEPASKGDAALAKSLEAAVIAGITSAHTGKVLGMGELRNMLNASATAQLLGCEDERCMIDAAGALAVDLLVAGRVGRVGDRLLISLSLMELKTTSVKARSSVSADMKGIELAAKNAGRYLLDPEAAKSGDQIFADLRTALLFEGVDDQGKAVAGGGIEGCVKERLLDAGVPLVSPAQVKRIRERLDPKSVVDGSDPLDAITDEHADVLLTGLVSYAPQGEKGAVKSWRADLDLQLVKVDSGEIIAAFTGESIALGATPAGASRTAAKKLCDDVRPALETALAKRYERGVRLQVEFTGVEDPAAAERIAEELRKLEKIVTRVHVRRVANGKATVDVVTRGADGVRFALALARAQTPLTVTEATPSTVRLSAR